MMKIQTIMNNVEQHYYNTIKPLFDKNQFVSAGFEIGNLLDYFQPCAKTIITYHSWEDFVGSARNLEKELIKGKEYPEGKIEIFETFLSQLILSIKSGNKYNDSR